MSLNVSSSAEHDPETRGRAIGVRHRRQIRRTSVDYGLLFDAAGLGRTAVREIAEDCFEHLAAWAPDLAAELTGVAEGAGLRLWEVAALNSRTEILVRGRIAGLNECSSAVWLPHRGHPHVIQTWDWVPWLNDFSVLHHVSPAGNAVVTFAENGVLAKIGVNDSGLGLLLTLMCHTSDGSTAGVPVHAVARRILDAARSVRDAVDIARSASVAASASFTIVTWDGDAPDATTIELSPAGVAEIAPEQGFLLHTNHFLDDDLATGDRLAAIEDDTLPRLAELRRRTNLLTSGTRTDWARGLASHWEDGAPLCAHPRPGAAPTNRWETKMTIGFDLDRAALLLHDGGPCGVTETGWTEFRAPTARLTEGSLR